MKADFSRTRLARRQATACTEAEWQEAVAMTRRCAPRELPSGWREEEVPAGQPFHGGRAYVHHRGLSVLLSAGRQEDGRWWLHVSATGRGRGPGWEELVEVKEIFIGVERPAIQLLPPRSAWISTHPYCLHLWACLEPDGDGLPNFGRHGTI